MKRLMTFFYGILAAGSWAMCIYVMIARPFLPATNNRAFIAFTIAGIVLTLIWLLIVRTSTNNQPDIYRTNDSHIMHVDIR